MNCGGCGNTCGAGRSCQGGMCACAPGNSMCGGLCINTMTDSMHCGACGCACPMGRSCVDGTCQINCTMPTELCVVAGVSTCVNTQSDPANCGGCGTVCTSANATAACGGGRCSLGPCNRDFGNCDRQAGNGCELNTNADGANCGGCDNVCPAPPNASASCAAGVCGVGVCNRGFGNCDGNPANGCESNTNTSAAHCGACGNRCPMGQACIAGVCVMGMMGAGFQVASLTSANCRIVDAFPASGDDRGGMALTQSNVLLTGDASTARFGINDFGGGAGVGRVMDAIFTNLGTETAYTFTSNGGVIGMIPANNPAHVNGLQALDVDGNPTGAVNRLSAAFSLRVDIGIVGLFSGHDRIVVVSFGRATEITISTGAVLDLGVLTLENPTSCESTLIHGVAELNNGQTSVLFARFPTQIMRQTVGNPVAVEVANFPMPGLGDMCTFTVSPSRGRWYFHHESPSFAGVLPEVIGFCDATFSR